MRSSADVGSSLGVWPRSRRFGGRFGERLGAEDGEPPDDDGTSPGLGRLLSELDRQIEDDAEYEALADPEDPSAACRQRILHYSSLK